MAGVQSHRRIGDDALAIAARDLSARSAASVPSPSIRCAGAPIWPCGSNRPHTAVAALRWFDAGKIDYALGGTAKVTCLSPDARQYGLLTPLQAFVGDDLVIVAPRTSLAAVKAKFGAVFDSIEAVSGIGQSTTVQRLTATGVFLGRRLHAPKTSPSHKNGMPAQVPTPIRRTTSV
jgi:hypothetical protein